MKPTRHSRNNSATEMVSRTSSSTNAVFNTKNKSQRTPKTTMPGSTTHDSKKWAVTPIESEKSTSAQLHKSRPLKKNDIGGDIFISGSTMPCTKNSKPRTMNAHDKYIKRQLNSSLTRHLRLRNCGLWRRNLSFVKCSLLRPRKMLGQALDGVRNPRFSRDTLIWRLQLREFDRCRTLYEKFLDYEPTNSYAWISYAELEKLLDDVTRVRAIYETMLSAIRQDWISPRRYGNRTLISKSVKASMTELDHYTRNFSIEQTTSKVWISYAQFEVSIPGGRRRRGRGSGTCS